MTRSCYLQRECSSASWLLNIVALAFLIGVTGRRQDSVSSDGHPPKAFRCNWDAANSSTSPSTTRSANRLPVYWINMAESTSRRKYMDGLLASPTAQAMGLGRNERVEAVTPESSQYRITMLEMPCKRNTQRDLAVILSHLTAMYRAVMDTSQDGSKSPYALILEDDIAFALPVDMGQLVATAPAGFGVLQLTTSCREAVHLIWRRFLKSEGTELWTLNHWSNTTRDKRYPLFWSAQAYIINKAVVRPFLDDVITKHSNGSRSFKIVNSFFPKHCQRTKTRPCILANCLFSDSYIFAGAGPTFVSNVPIVNGADIGRKSLIHQEHVERVHLPVFDLIRQTVSTLKERYEMSQLDTGSSSSGGGGRAAVVTKQAEDTLPFTSSARLVLPAYILAPSCGKAFS